MRMLGKFGIHLWYIRINAAVCRHVKPREFRMTETAILKQSKNPFSSFEKDEGFGFVVLAAMVNGVPAGASSLIGTRGAVLHHELGAVGNSGNPDALCASNLNALISPRKVPRGQTHFGFPSFQARLRRALTSVCSN